MTTLTLTSQASGTCVAHTVSELLRVGRKDANALMAPGHVPLTYGALGNQVDRTVAALNALGVGRHDRVAIVLPNGPVMASAFLAISAGATTAPLNPAYKAEEFAFYLNDLNATLLVVDAGSTSPAVAAAAEQGIPVAEIHHTASRVCGLFDLIAEKPSQVLKSGGFARADDIALVLHTSGTTSRPKLVPLSHHNLCASAHHVKGSLALAPEDRCLNVMPLFHIHGLVAALLGSIAAGGSVFCTPGFYVERFFPWIDEAQPTWYTAVPTMHQIILDQARQNSPAGAPTKLRLVRSSSASLPPTVMRALEDAFHAPVIEAYGMTEAAHQIASNPLPPRPRKPGSVGMAAGPDLAVMDQQGQILPPGATGEVVIRGPNVTTGYANNPDANATAFTNGWFRTGDQGVLDDDGYLWLTGRLKEIINRGGEKVMPREIDEALLEHPAVQQAVAFSVPHPTLGEDIAAAVVLREPRAADAQELRAFALARLAPFKVPSQIVLVDGIPKGPTGKLQRIGLAERLAPALKPPHVPPRNPIEETLVRMWREVTGADQVGVLDNFFALGGDSLRAAQLLSRVLAAFGVTLELDGLFREPTLAAQALIMEDAVLREVESAGEGQRYE